MENGNPASTKDAGPKLPMRNDSDLQSQQLLTQQNKMMDQMEQVMKKLQSIQSMQQNASPTMLSHYQGPCQDDWEEKYKQLFKAFKSKQEECEQY